MDHGGTHRDVNQVERDAKEDEDDEDDDHEDNDDVERDDCQGGIRRLFGENGNLGGMPSAVRAQEPRVGQAEQSIEGSGDPEDEDERVGEAADEPEIVGDGKSMCPFGHGGSEAGKGREADSLGGLGALLWTLTLWALGAFAGPAVGLEIARKPRAR